MVVGHHWSAGLAVLMFLIRQSSLAMFFLPVGLLVSKSLRMVCWLNLPGITFTSCMMRAGEAGAKTCLPSSLERRALCSIT